MEAHLLHLAVALKVGFCALVRNLHLPRRLLPIFLLVVAVHWSEHVAQIAQIHLLGWPRPEAGGILGLLFPVLVKREWLHTGFSLIMIVGLFGFRSYFTRTALVVWMVALGIQSFHTLEHQILFLQATAGLPAVSIVQAMLPKGLRPELHLFYNGAVTVPMLLAQGLMVLGGDMHLFSAFYRLGREHGHPIPFCLAQAWKQARARALNWSAKSWSMQDIEPLTRRLVETWMQEVPPVKLSFLQSLDGEVMPFPLPQATVLSQWVEHRDTGEKRPVRLRLIHTSGLLDMLESFGPEVFTAAFAAVTGHELAHVTLDMNGEGSFHGEDGTPPARDFNEELKADIAGIELAERAGFTNVRPALLQYMQRVIEDPATAEARPELELRFRAISGE